MNYTNELFSITFIKISQIKVQKKFFIIYGHYITEKNIHEYFYTPIHIFVQLLIRNELWRCRKYHKDTNTKKRKRK